MKFLPEERIRLRISRMCDNNDSVSYPYFSCAFHSMGVKMVPNLPSMAGVDARGRLYVRPTILEECGDQKKFESVMLHELWHILLLHRKRGEAFFGGPEGLKENARLWNEACDIEIHGNALSDRARFPLPDGALYPETFGFPPGKTAEFYAKELLKNPPNEGDKNGVQGNPNSDSDSDSPSSDSDSPSQSPDNTDSNEPGGSIVDGVQRSWEDNISDAGGLSRDEKEDIQRQRILDGMKSFAENNSRGSLPRSFNQWLEETLRPPQISWQARLKKLINDSVVTARGDSHETWARTSHLPIFLGAAFGEVPALPGLGSPEVEVAIIVDTSGSMNGNLLSSALSEVDGILKACTSQSATVLSVDADVHECERVFSSRSVKATGGGGTDMRIGITAALNLRPKPKIIIVLTDGYTPWPEERLGNYYLVVGLIGKRTASKHRIPSWVSEIVEIS